MNNRDLGYIEERLLSPCTRASDAYARLKNQHPAYTQQAERLMYAMQVFTDTCRTIQREIVRIERGQD